MGIVLNPWNYFATPEYFLRPSQAWKRIQRLWSRPGAVEETTLPWGARVQFRPNENIGRDLYLFGIHDKVVPEALCRLVDGGECALDIGANIGQNASLLAVLVGPTGTVIAFEPHPEIHSELRENAGLWSGLKLGKLQFEAVALSREPGEALLQEGEEFLRNRGAATITNDAQGGHRVSVGTLDHYLKNVTHVGVCKIDVEGHELAVLEGATQTLSERRIRDIIVEDFNPQPSPVSQLLIQSGYTVFELYETWRRPLLLALGEELPGAQNRSFNFLATLDPGRAKSRFVSPGWKCLTGF